LLGAHPPQLRAERNEVEVVDPDEIVGPKQRHELSGEKRVDREIGPVLLAIVLEKTGAIVE
jgi:hypothetical protein